MTDGGSDLDKPLVLPRHLEICPHAMTLADLHLDALCHRVFDRQALGLTGIQAEAVCCPHSSASARHADPPPDPSGRNLGLRVRGSFVGEHGTKAHPASTVTGHYDTAIGALTYSIS